MLGTILSVLGFVKPLLDQLATARASRDNAETEQARIAADAEVRRLEARVAAQSVGRGAMFMRIAFGVPIAIYFGKIFLWDKVLKWGTTDDLTAQQWQVVMVVLGFYFVTELLRR